MKLLRETLYELFKMGSHKKNYIPLAGYLLFILLCYIACRSSFEFIIKRMVEFGLPRADAVKYLDGFFFARVVQIPTFVVLMPIVMAALGGDCVAGEMQEGSLKLYLARPRSRTQVVVAKFAAIYSVGLIYSIIFSVGGLLTGWIFFDLAPAQVIMIPARMFSSTLSIMTNFEALARYMAVTLYYSFSLMTMGSMALFFSVIFNRMSSAAIAVITLYFVSYVVASLPFAEGIRPWLISEIMNNSFLLYLSPVPMGKLVVNLSVLGIYIAGFLFASIFHFNCKDIR